MNKKEQAIQFYLNRERANDAFDEFYEEYKGVDFGELHEGLELANSGKLSRDEYIKVITNLYKHIDKYHLKIESDYKSIGELYYRYKAMDENNYKRLSTQDDKFIKELKFRYAILSRNYLLLSTAKEIIDKYYKEVVPYEKWMQPSSLNTTLKKTPTKGIDSIITERAKKYFQRAIESGYMEETKTGYKWGHGIKGDKVKLGYFLKQIYNPNEFSQIPYQALENLFEENRLDSTIDKMKEWKKEPKWVYEIEETIFYD